MPATDCRPADLPVSRAFVTTDGVAHQVVQTDRAWQVFDDPDRVEGASGLAVAACGALVRDGGASPDRACLRCVRPRRGTAG